MRLRWRSRGLSEDKFGAWQTVKFADQLQLILSGCFGRRGLSAAAKDLLTVALSVHSIERSLTIYSGTNRPVAFDVRLELEEPERWTTVAVQHLSELLQFQGDATWQWTFLPTKRATSVDSRAVQIVDREIDQAVLFSGGLDSTSGIATLCSNANRIQLVSHYSKQKSDQNAIAEKLGYLPPIQARIVRKELGSRGRAFLYRSFYFLCLGGAAAASYDIKSILQFENGMLAAAIPPAPTYFMTRHAHPIIHRHAEMIFSEIFGGTWTISNPFLSMTKKDAVAAMRKAVGKKLFDQLIPLTETCWYKNSNQFRGNHAKANGKPCGVCIPCIVRRTAMGISEGEFDLEEAAVKSDPILSREFDAYSQFVDWIKAHQKTPNRILLELPGYVREMTRGTSPALDRTQLSSLLDRFAKDFRNAF